MSDNGFDDDDDFGDFEEELEAQGWSSDEFEDSHDTDSQFINSKKLESITSQNDVLQSTPGQSFHSAENQLSLDSHNNNSISQEDFNNPDELKISVQNLMENAFPGIAVSESPIRNDFVKDDLVDYKWSPAAEQIWSHLHVLPQVSPHEWTRSAVRRMFLVNLGVPLNLDEILPTKQRRKLVLHTSGENSGANKDFGKEVKDESLDSPGVINKKDQVDEEICEKTLTQMTNTNIDEWTRLSNVTAVALESMSKEDILAFTQTLENKIILARRTLSSWKVSKQSEESQKESLESVIENMLGYAQKQRFFRAASIKKKMKSNGK